MGLGWSQDAALSRFHSKTQKHSPTFEVELPSRAVEIELRARTSQEKTRWRGTRTALLSKQACKAGGRARRPFALENLKGVNEAPVFAYPSGEFAVIVSEHLPSKPLTQQSIVEHSRVISDCFRTVTVLPFRFGTIFESDEALRRAVRANRKAFTGKRLARLRGKSEMHVKIVVKDGTIEEAIADIPDGSRRRISAQTSRPCQPRARTPDQGAGALDAGP